MSNTAQSSLAGLFSQFLTNVQNGQGTEAVKNEFREKLYEVSRKKPAAQERVKPKTAKPAQKKTMAATKKKKPASVPDTIENRIEAQRETRNGAKIRTFAKKSTSTIYEKIKKQRLQRKQKSDPNLEPGKDPKKVRSRKIKFS